jgi:hypothetical protein
LPVAEGGAQLSQVARVDTFVAPSKTFTVINARRELLASAFDHGVDDCRMGLFRR